MRRSTSLAVCWAPIRMMPSERPRSETSTRISLIGLPPSRGAYLFSSSSTTNRSGRCAPARSFSSKARRRVTPTTNRLARSLRLWMSTTVTCAWRRMRWRSGLGTSPRISRSRWRTAPKSRRTRALTVPAPRARPAHSSRVSSFWTRSAMNSAKERKSVRAQPSITTPPSSKLSTFASFAATLWIAIVYCWRSSSASVNTNGNSRSRQNSASVQKKEVTPVCRVATSGAAARSPGRGGAQNSTLSNGPGSRPRRV